MYTIITYCIIVILVAMFGAAVFLSSLVLVLAQSGVQTIAKLIHGHAVANMRLQPQESAARARVRAKQRMMAGL